VDRHDPRLADGEPIMTARRAARPGPIAWAIAIADVVTILIVSLVDPGLDGASGLLYVVGIASFVFVGALLRSRVPGNPIGGLLLTAGTLLVIAVSVGTYADIGELRSPPWPGSDLARHVGNAMFIYPFAIAFIGIPLVFPDGHLPSPRFRWVAGLAIAAGVAWALGALFSTPTDGVVLVGLMVSFAGAMTAIGLRFRRGSRVEREQIKWPLASAGAGVILLVASLLVEDPFPDLANLLDIVGILNFFVLPIALGIAVLRYRLYDIDRIISRTISYGVITALLVAVFLVVNLALQAALSSFTSRNALAVAGSTLLAAALFTPIRGRVQRSVDRRFDRAHYDADRLAIDFADRLRDEIDLSALGDELDSTVRRAFAPSSVDLWLRGARDDQVSNPEGRTA
jgi:hypothetical protein